MTFNVEIVLKGHDSAVTHTAFITQSVLDDGAVHDILVEMLRSIDRVEHPDVAADRPVILRGLSWIVEPSEGQSSVIAIEIPMGAAVAGPFAVDQAELAARVERVLRAEPQLSSSPTIH